MCLVVGTVAAGPAAAVFAVGTQSALVGPTAAIVHGAISGAGAAVTGLGTASGAATALTGTVMSAAATAAEMTAANLAASAAGGTLLSGAAQGAVTAATLSGPLGWAVLGANGHTWDCWKPVVMDDSTTPSCGITLRDLYNHPNLREMVADSNGFLAENIRGEQFRLSPVDANGTLAFHATAI